MAQRGSYAKGVAKRTEILDTALDVVARNGFRGTSVRELADSVGLSQAGLLHYFDSKDELFTAILRRRDEVDYALADEHVDIVEQLIAVIRHNADVPGLVQLFASMSTAATSDPSHAAHAYFAERYASIRAQVAGAIADRQDRGEVPAGVDPTRLATVLLAVSDGMQIQWMLDPGTDMAEHVELVWRLALAGVATPS